MCIRDRSYCTPEVSLSPHSPPCRPLFPSPHRCWFLVRSVIINTLYTSAYATRYGWTITSIITQFTSLMRTNSVREEVTTWNLISGRRIRTNKKYLSMTDDNSFGSYWQAIYLSKSLKYSNTACVRIMHTGIMNV